MTHQVNSPNLAMAKLVGILCMISNISSVMNKARELWMQNIVSSKQSIQSVIIKLYLMFQM
jgi:hypothetical protein